MSVFKPMLAAKVDDAGLATLPYPLWGSAKLDGVRMSVHAGPDKPIAQSRSMTPFPNQRLQLQFGREELLGYDGELCVGNLTDKNLCDNTRAETSTIHGPCTATFHVFDRHDVDMEYANRYARIYDYPDLRVFRHEQVLLNNADDVLDYEARQVEAGYEGIIIRRPDGRYKQNRSTLREALLLKVKRYEDAEAIVIGFEELMHNANEATTSNTGHTKRATFQENLVPMDTLGALIVRGINGTFKDVVFNIGTGFTAAQRKAIWLNRERVLGKICTYKYFPIGVKDKPRHPVFKCFREARDM